MNLFADAENKNRQNAAPLAVRMRPRNLTEFVGQQAFIAPGKLLWRMLQADRLTSLIFYGPPGTGKTTLANVIARQSSAAFIPTNAAQIGVAEIRTIIKTAQDRLAVEGRRTVLFLDEIHRFTRSQQDVLLDDVENGTVTLIGATTENPFFTVNSALVSRSTIFEFEVLTIEDIKTLLTNALKDPERGLGKYQIEITPDALEYLALMSDGDARRALTALEVGVLSQVSISNDQKSIFDKELAVESIQKKALVSDPAGDNHYDLASALQKSMRGSDPNATVYYLARLIVGGEDLRFIARRIAICAAEDVGNADPAATILAAAAVQIAEFVGFPEAQLPLAQAAIYVACAPKSNSCTQAIQKASQDIKNGRTIPVPAHLRDSHYPGAAKLNRGVNYEYSHNFPNAVSAQTFLPEGINEKYYQPTDRGREKQISHHLEQLEIIKTQLRASKNHPESSK